MSRIRMTGYEKRMYCSTCNKEITNEREKEYAIDNGCCRECDGLSPYKINNNNNNKRVDEHRKELIDAFKYMHATNETHNKRLKKEESEKDDQYIYRKKRFVYNVKKWREIARRNSGYFFVYPCEELSKVWISLYGVRRFHRHTV